MTTPTTSVAQSDIDSYFEAAGGRHANVRMGIAVNPSGKNFTETVPVAGGAGGSLYSDRLAADGSAWMKKTIHRDADTGGVDVTINFGALDMVTFHAVLKQVSDGLANVVARALSQNWKNFAVPTFTTLTAALKTIPSATQGTITLADITAQSNAAGDTGRTIVGYVVQALSGGTLLIGASAGTPTAYVAGSNDTIDATKNAYYTVAAGGAGSVNAFTMKAKDDKGWLSASAIQATVTRS